MKVLHSVLLRASGLLCTGAAPSTGFSTVSGTQTKDVFLSCRSRRECEQSGSTKGLRYALGRQVVSQGFYKQYSSYSLPVPPMVSPLDRKKLEDSEDQQRARIWPSWPRATPVCCGLSCCVNGQSPSTAGVSFSTVVTYLFDCCCFLR